MEHNASFMQSCFKQPAAVVGNSIRRRLLWTSLIGTTWLAIITTTASAAIVVTPTTSGSVLAAALGGTGLTIDSVSGTNGASGQFGTYTNFSSGPVKFANGVVLSTGNVADTPAPANAGSLPSTETGASGTAEFDAYGPGRIENFTASFDVARMQVNFTLSSASAVSFDFIFGSVEYPVYTSNYTDAFLTFLDGTTNQIVFDSLANPVQVGTSFASQLTTADLNTAFADPHGLLQSLTTTTAVLAPGSHTLLFEVGDVNDPVLDSAAFIANLRVGEGSSGTTPTVPIPAAVWLFGSGLLGLIGVARRKKASDNVKTL
jgi:hypothetical protein